MISLRITTGLKQIVRHGYWHARSVLGGRGLATFRIVQSAENLIRQFIRDESAHIFGHRMHLGRNDDLELSVNGVFSPQETRTILREIRQGETVVDIGANIGYFTLLFARLVGPTGRVFAFEPEPENFGLLQRNVRCNGYGNVILIPKAVSDRSGTTSLFLAEHKGDARIFDSHDGRARIPVETVRLDDYFAEEERGVDFVKMDIQGAEPAAIKGMAKLLEKNNRTTLLLEFWPNGLKLFGVEPESFLRTLADLGFEFWRIDEQEARTVPTTAAELLNRYPARDDDFFNFTNLLCKRRGA